ncbi:MAG: DUF1501 domain-containing protein, partial [Actinomycetota bacterium]
MSLADHPAPNPVVDIRGRHTRREFLRRAGLLSGAGLAMPWALELASLANATPVGADDGYRAIVCVFLYGGNDHADTFVPNDDIGYAAYAAARGDIAHPLGTVRAITPRGGFRGAGTFGFAPELARLHDLFGRGDAAVVANVGSLQRPLTKSEYAVVSNRPPQLFSHNDQQSFWQAAAPEGATTGWGGRIADLLLDGNGAGATFTCVSVSGNAVMMTGDDALQYQVSPGGVTTLRRDLFRYDAMDDGLRELMELELPGMFPESYVDTTRRALAAADDLSSAIDTAAALHTLDEHFELDSANNATSRLSAQLRMVARLIAAGRDVLGLRRQVFFVGLGGFDNHDGLVAEHRPLLSALDSGLAGFHAAMTAMGAGDQVTSFTASDFGRTLVSNGDGTDHGWGGHHLVIGGAVAGNEVYGDVPVTADDGPDDVGRGRLLPTVSVDQYASTFAGWMGAGSSEL